MGLFFVYFMILYIGKYKRGPNAFQDNIQIPKK